MTAPRHPGQQYDLRDLWTALLGIGKQANPTPPQSGVLTTDLFIDPVGGSDLNVGSALAPLQTWGGATGAYSRLRNGVVGVRQVTFMNTVATWPAGDPIVGLLPTVTTPDRLTLRGQVFVARSGTLSAVTQRNRAANTRQAVTDGVFSFSPAGRFLRMTSGAASGAGAWLANTAVAGTAQISDLVDLDTIPGFPLQVAPAVGNYQIQTFIVFPEVQLFGFAELNDPATFAPGVVLRNMSFNSAGGSQLSYDGTCDECSLVGPGNFVFMTLASPGFLSVSNCKIIDGTGGFANNTVFGPGLTQINAGLFLAMGSTGLNVFGFSQWNNDVMFEAAAGHWETFSAGSMDMNANLAIYNSVNVVTMRKGATLSWTVTGGNNIYGTGNTAGGPPVLAVEAGSRIILRSDATFPVAGYTVGFTLGSRGSGPAVDESVDPKVWTANRTYSIANLIATVAAGGFARNATDPTTQASISSPA